MTFAPKSRGIFYWLTGIFATAVAFIALVFSFAGGLGWRYLAPALAAFVLVPAGLLTSLGSRSLGHRISFIGGCVLACATLMNLIELAFVIPFRTYPTQAVLLVAPASLLLVAAAHILVAVPSISCSRSPEQRAWPR